MRSVLFPDFLDTFSPDAFAELNQPRRMAGTVAGFLEPVVVGLAPGEQAAKPDALGVVGSAVGGAISGAATGAAVGTVTAGVIEGGVVGGASALVSVATGAGAGAAGGSALGPIGALLGLIVGLVAGGIAAGVAATATTPDEARVVLYEIGYLPGPMLRKAKILHDIPWRDMVVIRHARYVWLASLPSYGLDRVNAWLKLAGETDGTQAQNPMPQAGYFRNMADAFVQLELEQLIAGQHGECWFIGTLLSDGRFDRDWNSHGTLVSTPDRIGGTWDNGVVVTPIVSTATRIGANVRAEDIEQPGAPVKADHYLHTPAYMVNLPRMAPPPGLPLHHAVYDLLQNPATVRKLLGWLRDPASMAHADPMDADHIATAQQLAALEAPARATGASPGEERARHFAEWVDAVILTINYEATAKGGMGGAPVTVNPVRAALAPVGLWGRVEELWTEVKATIPLLSTSKRLAGVAEDAHEAQEAQVGERFDLVIDVRPATARAREPYRCAGHVLEAFADDFLGGTDDDEAPCLRDLGAPCEEARIVVVCHSGARARRVACAMLGRGWTGVRWWSIRYSPIERT